MDRTVGEFFLWAESWPEAIFISSRGCFRYLNPAALDILGASSAEQLLGTSVLERIHPQLRDEVAARMQKLYADRQNVLPLQETFFRLDGEMVELEVAAIPFDYEGENGALVIARNITERLRVEAEVRRERQFLRQITNATPNLIYVKHRSGRYLLVNQAMARAYGTTVDGILGKGDADFNSNSEEVERFRRDEQEVMATGRIKRITAQALTFADGTRHWVKTTWIPLVDPDGMCNKVLGISTDISDLKQAQSEVENSQQLLQSIVDNSRAAIYVKDLEGCYQLLNQTAAILCRLSRDAMLGRSDYDLFPRDVADRLRAADLEVVSSGKALEFEETVPLDDGPRTVLSLKFPLLDSEGRPRAVCGISTDITERKRAEEEVRRLNHTLEERVQERTKELQAKKEQLREALALNENILMNSRTAILAYRQDGRCILANPAAASLFGQSRQALLELSFRSMTCWQAGVLAAAEKVLARGVGEEQECHFSNASGKEVWVSVQLSRFLLAGAPHVLFMVRDVTDQRSVAQAMAEREQSFRTLADNVPDCISRFDLEGRSLYVNRTAECIMGCDASDLVGRRPGESFPDGRYQAIEEAVLQTASSGMAREIEFSSRGPDGLLRCHQIRLVPELGADGKPVSVLAVGHDLTERKVAEEKLRLAASVFHNSTEGVLVTDADAVILSVNPAFTAITGYIEAEAIGKKPNILRSNRHRQDFYRDMWNSLLTIGRWQGEIWNRRKDGEAFLEWLTINRIDDHNGRPVNYVSVFHDITELRRKDERIHHLAFHDALTGLPNRILLLDRLQHAIDRAEREGRRLTLMFIDLDRFKQVNDALGHDVGDQLLQTVADRIRYRLRAGDTIARLGGDEFVVLTEDLKDADSCANLADILITTISKPMDLCGYNVEVGASLGIALYPEDGVAPMELMKRADMAMYAAKAAGRNTYRFFKQQMLDLTSQRLGLEMDMRRAIAFDQLEVYYQPRICLSSGALMGVEALVRWHHPERGFLEPKDFIPIAEESDLIVDIGAWMLDAACRQIAVWRRRGRGLLVAVNVSARQLKSGDLVEQLQETMAMHGIPPSSLELELTESTVMDRPDNVADIFMRLKELGVTVAVDDFGTGYSSLAYLRRLPINILKIDRSFVANIERDDDDLQIVKIILALAQALKLSVVAEGIESREQAELLASLGCPMGQGYHFSPPIPASEFEAWMDAREKSATTMES